MIAAGAPLTPREREVWTLVAAGYTNPEIARELHIAHGTAKVYVSRLIRDLGAKNRVHAAYLWGGAITTTDGRTNMDGNFYSRLREDSGLWVPDWVDSEAPADGEEAEAEEFRGEVNYGWDSDLVVDPEVLHQEMIEFGVYREPEVVRAEEEAAGSVHERALTYAQMYPTRLFFTDRVKASIQRIQSDFPWQTYTNTYERHPPVYGHKYEHVSVDYWGGGRRDGRYLGYRGRSLYAQLTLAEGTRLFNAIFSDPKPPNIYWIIHRGRMWSRGLGWGPSPGGPAGSDARHDHHIHITYLP